MKVFVQMESTPNFRLGLLIPSQTDGLRHAISAIKQKSEKKLSPIHYRLKISVDLCHTHLIKSLILSVCVTPTIGTK
jgi:hypothetical protein